MNKSSCQLAWNSLRSGLRKGNHCFWFYCASQVYGEKLLPIHQQISNQHRMMKWKVGKMGEKRPFYSDTSCGEILVLHQKQYGMVQLNCCFFKSVLQFGVGCPLEPGGSGQIWTGCYLRTAHEPYWADSLETDPMTSPNPITFPCSDKLPIAREAEEITDIHSSIYIQTKD